MLHFAHDFDNFVIFYTIPGVLIVPAIDPKSNGRSLAYVLPDCLLFTNDGLFENEEFFRHWSVISEQGKKCKFK